MPFSWECPYCQSKTTIGPDNEHVQTGFFGKSNPDGKAFYKVHFIVCPNPECNKFTLSIELLPVDEENNRTGDALYWRLIPSTFAKIFPDYIPEAILNDYTEACAIRDLSPKASATLARRCLQGMIRDFWGIHESTLYHEINAIQEYIDPISWQAINAVRKIGNIGAHMERDIGTIIDVEPVEAQLLIGLIETLIKEWYIGRYERQKSMEELIEMARIKEEMKNN